MQAWEEKYYEREEGREEGELLALIALVQKKIAKGKNFDTIVDEVEESVERIKPIYECVKANMTADKYDILDLLVE